MLARMMLAAAVDETTRIGTFHCPDGGAGPTPASIGGRVGDLAVAMCPFNGSATGGGGSWSSAGSGTCIRWRTLTSGDLSVGVTLGRGGDVAIYRGANDLALISSNSYSGGGLSRTLAGFSRSSSHAGLIVATRSVAANFDQVEVNAPATFSEFGSHSYYAGIIDDSTKTGIAAYDRLPPGESLYEGQSFSYGWDTTGGTKYFHVFELRRV